MQTDGTQGNPSRRTIMPIPDTNPTLKEKRTCIDSTSGNEETDLLPGGAQR
jgi:hypothetical protein